MLKKIFLGAIFSLFSLSANSTILAICAEDVNCVLTGSITTTTTSTFYDSNYARLAFFPTGGGTTSVPPPNRVGPSAFSANSNFWISFELKTNGNGTTANASWVTMWDGATVRLMIRGTGGDGLFKLSKRTSAGTITDLVTASSSICSSAAMCKIDIHVVYAVAGSVTMYDSTNGTTILSYTGDVTTDSATTLSKVEFATARGLSTQNYFSEMIISTVDTRSMRVKTLIPQAAGTTQDWSGALVGNINEAVSNDSNFNSTVTSNQRSDWTINSLPAGVAVPHDLFTCIRASRGASGPQNYRHSLFVNSSNYDNGSDVNPGVSFGDNCYQWGANSPDSGAVWTRSEFTGMNIGVLSEP